MQEPFSILPLEAICEGIGKNVDQLMRQAGNDPATWRPPPPMPPLPLPPPPCASGGSVTGKLAKGAAMGAAAATAAAGGSFSGKQLQVYVDARAAGMPGARCGSIDDDDALGGTDDPEFDSCHAPSGDGDASGSAGEEQSAGAGDMGDEEGMRSRSRRSSSSGGGRSYGGGVAARESSADCNALCAAAAAAATPLRGRSLRITRSLGSSSLCWRSSGGGSSVTSGGGSRTSGPSSAGLAAAEGAQPAAAEDVLAAGRAQADVVVQVEVAARALAALSDCEGEVEGGDDGSDEDAAASPPDSGACGDMPAGAAAAVPAEVAVVTCQAVDYDAEAGMYSRGGSDDGSSAGGCSLEAMQRSAAS